MRKLALALLPIAFSVQSAHADAPLATSGSTYKPLAMTVDTLDNGLRVVVVPMSGSPTVAFYTLVMAGSRDEVEPGRSGYAHLFEHLMFRGTQKIPAADYEKKMQSFGADNNAFTTDDFTFFVPLIPKESLADLVPIEADRFEHLDVAQAPYRDETGAVAGEYNKDFSNPWWAMDEAIREIAYTQHTYGHTVIGYKRDVDAMPQNHAYSKTFFSRFYVPDDCVIFAVGDVDRDSILALVKKNYGDWKGKRAQPVIRPEPEQTAPHRRDLVWKAPTTPRMLFGWKVPSAKDHLADSAALDVLTTLVFGEPSELYQRLVVREQKVIELGADPDEVLHKDPGMMRVDAKLKEGTSFDEITTQIQSALDAVAQGKVDDKELADAKNHLTSSIVLGMQTPGAVAERLAFLTAATGDTKGFDHFMTFAMGVTKDDVIRVAKLLTPAHRNLVTLSPPARAHK
ncbi:MAG TPA: pitrilysin family protein [Polyangiaceae bacterium]|nr:pitrilysin family protein [Polyangiaceae bacterium]